MRRFARFLILFSSLPSFAAVCPTLTSGSIVKVVVSSSRSACVTVSVAEGEAVQITATQPSDIVLHVHSQDSSVLVDGFQFGPETVTIDAAGQYLINVSLQADRTVSAVRLPPVTIDMSRRLISLQAARTFSVAEKQATASTLSGTIEDILASLRLWQALNETSAVARTWLKAGDAVLDQGDLARARDDYEVALNTCHAIGDVRCAAEAENNSGTVSRQLGDFDLSLTRLTDAGRDWRQLGERILEGKTLSNLGFLYRQSSDYQTAISLYERAEQILAARDPLGNAVVLNNLGLCYQELSEFAKARGYFERAFAVENAAPGGSKAALAAEINLGRNYLLNGQSVRARRILNSALTAATARNDRTGTATVLNNLGQVLLASHMPGEARIDLQQALGLHRNSGDQRLAASDLHYLGVAASSLGDTEAARDLFKQAIDIRRRSLLRDAAADSLCSLAELERTAGHPGKTREYAEQALTLLESVRSQVPGAALRASFYSQKRRFFDLLLETVVTPDNPHAAEDGLLAAERGRGRALLDMLAEGSMPHLLPGDLLERRKDLQRRIDIITANLATAKPKQEGALHDQVERLVAEDEQIEAEFRQSLATQPLGQPLESVGKLQQEFLPGGAALLEFHLGQRESYLFLVTRESVQVLKLPARGVVEAQAGKAVELFNAILDRRRSPEKQAAFERAMRLVSHTLFGQLLTTGLPRLLIIVPDGSLYRMPFAALRSPSEKLALGLNHDLIQIPTAAYLGAGRKPRAISAFPETVVAVVDPVFSAADPRVIARSASVHAGGADLARLPFAGELEEIDALVPPARRRVLRGFDDTLEKLRHMELKDFAVLHFSTHAVIDDHVPELSRIALSLVDRSGRTVDGFLRPYQLSEFRLEGSTVVLSACDTGLGKEIVGEGLAGFSASLLQAGAAQILLTLAEVDAEGSSEFLRQTYRHLFSREHTAMEHSLTLARRNLAQSPRWSDPYYWASFVLYGRPGGVYN